MTDNTAILDGNEAAASVAHRLNEVNRHLPHYPGFTHWGVGGPVERGGTPEHLGLGSHGHRNAE